LNRPVAEETRALRRPTDDSTTRVLRPPPPGEAPETLHLDDGPTLAQERPAVELSAGDDPADPSPVHGESGAADGPTRRLFAAAGAREDDGTPGARAAGQGGSPGSAGDGEGSTDGADRSPGRVDGVHGVDGGDASGGGDTPVPDEAKPPAKKKLTSAGALIWVLLLLLGYTLVVQLRSNNDDQGLATARQEDLVSILSDLESRDSRLQTEIQSLESSQRQLTSGVSSRQAALAEAEKRADELGLLAGTLPGKGPGLKITIDKVKASEILNAVQELRGSGGEVMELAGVNGTAVRIVASSYFVEAQGGGIDADGTRLTGPWTLWVIGSPQTMQTALQIPGGVVASINGAGGSVTMEAQTMVEVTAVRKAGSLQYAKPTS
jgi:uncharacterized protein YlxW (UPF0749 family)